MKRCYRKIVKLENDEELGEKKHAQILQFISETQLGQFCFQAGCSYTQLALCLIATVQSEEQAFRHIFL